MRESGKDIPVPDSLGKETFLVGIFTSSKSSVVTSRPVDKSAGNWGEASSTGLARFVDWREYMHGLSVAVIELSLMM